MVRQKDILKQIVIKLNKAGEVQLANRICEIENRRIHVAVMVEPYLSLILEGKKTIESRFSRNRISPFQKIESGDIVILKRSGGGYVALFEAGEISFFQPQNEKDMETIRDRYNDRLCISDDFWEEKKDTRYATLIDITNLCCFEEFQINAPNRKSWIDFTDDTVIQTSICDAPLIICIAGKAGSGKTTVAKYLSARIKCRYVTVSDYLRTLCDTDSPSREELQSIGDTCISKGWANFVHDFLEYVDWNGHESLIIEGIRHVDFMKMLIIEFYPYRPICAFLRADQGILNRNIINRGIEVIDQNPVSEGVNEKMKECADIIVLVKDNSVEQIGEKIFDFSHSYNRKNDDSNTDISTIRQYIDGFNSRRGWKKYHNPKEVAISISLEAAELLETFQWGAKGSLDRIQEELADVLIYSIDLANSMNLDIVETVLKKMKRNEIKYPEK